MVLYEVSFFGGKISSEKIVFLWLNRFEIFMSLSRLEHYFILSALEWETACTRLTDR